jgi:hypothetical protein
MGQMPSITWLGRLTRGNVVPHPLGKVCDAVQEQAVQLACGLTSQLQEEKLDTAPHPSPPQREALLV